MAIGALASGALFFIQRGDWQMAALLFGVGNIGFAASLAFYDSLLRHGASEDEIDRVSTAGYAIGYLGGGLLLALNVAWILSPSTFGLPDAALASRLSFLSVALWWPLFSIPLLRQVAEPAIARTGPAQSASTLVVTAFRSLGQTLRDLRRYRNAFLLL